MKRTAQAIVKESRRELVNELVKRMENGVDMIRPMWNTEALRPYNPESGYTYRYGNRLRLALSAQMQGFMDPRWMTFKQAQAAGYQVKRGSKGTLLEKWIFEREVEEVNEKGEKEKVTKKLDHPIVTYFKVFNAEQISGMPDIPKVQPMKRDEMVETAEIFMRASECTIREKKQDKAYYDPVKDEIVLPDRDYFKNSEAFLSVGLHEMAHSTGHESRLNRPMMNRYGTQDYAREELNAEIASAFIQTDLGINLQEETLDDHAAYIRSWIKILKKDPDALFYACNNAERISDRLMTNYEKQLQKEISRVQEPKEKEAQKEEYVSRGIDRVRKRNEIRSNLKNQYGALSFEPGENGQIDCYLPQKPGRESVMIGYIDADCKFHLVKENEHLLHESVSQSDKPEVKADKDLTRLVQDVADRLSVETKLDRNMENPMAEIRLQIDEMDNMLQGMEENIDMETSMD